MSFQPEVCPGSGCEARNGPEGRFFLRWGSFRRALDGREILRFRCRSCRRTFSVQTFRYDYRQRRPELDALVFRNLVSGMGQRQLARITGASRDTIARKLRRLAGHLAELHDRVATGLKGRLSLGFDELETFEHCRLTKPVTMGTLIELDSMFVLDQANGMMSARPVRNARAKEMVARHEAIHGRRRHESRSCVAAIFGRGAARLDPKAEVELTTDRKSTYPGLARRAFGERLVAHHRHSSRMRRRPGSPMHRVNLTNAMWRDNLGRLHRRSWLASKCRRWLERHGVLFVAYRNYIRTRFNGEDRTPAQLLGIQRCRLDFEDLLAWRADRRFEVPISWARSA